MSAPLPSTSECVRMAGGVIRRELEHRPYAALGVAVGVGFIAAGGLASPAVWGLARIGARLAAAVATRKLGEALAEPLLAAGAPQP